MSGNAQRLATAATALAMLAVVGCGKSADEEAAPSASSGLVSTTPEPAQDVDRVSWATYRDVKSVDPIQAFDYPENTVVTSLCESLQRQRPDGTITPGIAELSHPDDATLVIELRDQPTFWDGQKVSAEDVVFSLQRAADPKLGGFYPQVFDRVASVKASSPTTVTVKLREPDYWLDGELSGMPGVVVQREFAVAAGRGFGTPDGGTMCTGPFKLESWAPGAELRAVRNDAYWDDAAAPRAAEIDFQGVPTESSLTSGLETGEIDGTYAQPLGGIERLKSSDAVTVTEGPSFATDALIVSSLDGALGDVRVRRALSLAVDRDAYIERAYGGTAQLPRTFANPGTWGYARDVFERNWNEQPALERDLAEARKLIAEAGADGETITIGMTPEIDVINTAATAVRSAGEAIGLQVRFKAVPAQSYIEFFTDPSARRGIDAFLTVNYPDYADPAALYKTFALPGAIQNYSGYENPKVTAALDEARATSDPEARAELVAEAGDLIMQDLPWIPLALPNSVLITSADLTGAPASFVYMGGPWANLLGGT